MITFYNGVANKGRMVAPRLVDRIECDGEVVERMPVVTLVEKMCSKSTLVQLDSCLAASARRSNYHFRDLAIPFGCKTGTAQMWSSFISDSRIDKIQMENGINGPQDNYYYGSIICTMPLEQPRYTILVGVCKQRTAESLRYYGIDLAGPVAADIMEYIYTNDPSLHYTLERPEEAYEPQSIKRTIADVEIEEGKVPNVKGMGLTDAIYLLERSGLRVTHSGSGKVKSQSIPAGREITNKDLTIHLNLGR
jgi:cell division protein FtsI (penicillin-binding protein 3)